MSHRTPTGRHAIKAAAAQVDLDRDATPASDAIAHVLCRMGGHIPNIDNEQAGACDFHRRHAVVAARSAAVSPSPVDTAARYAVDQLSEGARRRLAAGAYFVRLPQHAASRLIAAVEDGAR